MNDDAPAKASSTHVADQVDVLRYATDEWKPMNDCRAIQRDRGRGMRACRGNGSLDVGSSLRLVFILEWEIAYGSWIEKPVVPRKGVPVLGHFVSLLEVRVDAKRVSTGTRGFADFDRGFADFDRLRGICPVWLTPPVELGVGVVELGVGVVELGV